MFRLCALIVLLLPVSIVTPWLEIGPTHVLNPDWPGHARLHVVWQLATNTALAGLAIWIAASRQDMRLASAIGLVIHGAFFAALVASPAYEGTMRHSDGSELAVGGINVAVVIMALATAGLCALFMTSSSSARAKQDIEKNNI